jgi:hypothetical protein
MEEKRKCVVKDGTAGDRRGPTGVECCWLVVVLCVAGRSAEDGVRSLACGLHRNETT